MNNLERANKYRNIQWTEDQGNLLGLIFEALDVFLLDCQTEGNQDKNRRN